jgi:excisionase family DNA binding protein
MRLDPSEIEAFADSLANRVADILEQRLSERPELACSIQEAAAIVNVPEHVVRDACEDGRLPCFRAGRSVRIRRSDLFAIRSGEGGR